MADTKISALTALTGANVATDDVFVVVDTSTTTTKKITAPELEIALKSVPATQAEQETGTSTSVSVTPGRQHFHPSAAKAWGLITHATTVTVSYPAAGVSNTNPSTGQYIVTHGRTMSSASYAVLVTPFSAVVKCWTITARDATTFEVLFTDVNGAAIDVTSFSYMIFGDI